jgi:transcriptional regulator with XRE-family HTH domain
MSAEERQDVGLGKAVELRRIELGLKRRELAERAQLSYPYISEIENGVKEPSAKALRRIAEALEMKLADLATLSERLEEPSDSGSILLDAPAAVGTSPRSTTPEAMNFSMMPEAPRLARSMAAAASPAQRPLSDMDRVQAQVREELDRWRREELPHLVRSEVERHLAKRDAEVTDR